MNLFDRFSDRAKRAVFCALYTAIDDGADHITPEHILHALIHTDPDLFHLVAPHIPDLLDNLKKEYCDGVVNPFDRNKLKPLPFSLSSLDILRAANKYRAHFGHQHVEVGHLLLAIAARKGPFTVWFTRRVSHSQAQESLLKLGVTPFGLEARVREGATI
jgi:ATP-dependent Clp protease ATP-binding subunit ClpA